MFIQNIRRPFVLLTASLAIAGLFSVNAMADDASDVQKAIDKAGFGGNRIDSTDSTQVQDPHAKNENAAPAAPAPKSGYELGALSYKFNTYMNTPDLKVNYKSYGDESPLPKPDSVTEGYAYGRNFQRNFGQVVIGPPPAATDGRVHHPSEPWWSNDPDSIFRYSGDTWGDCLGPKCIDRGEFRAPVGSWVHFTEIGTTRADQYYNLIGFNDTLEQLSIRFGGQAVELTGDRK